MKYYSRYIYYYWTTHRLNFVFHDEDRTIRESFIGYSLKEAIRTFREKHNLKNKTIKIICMQ